MGCRWPISSNVFHRINTFISVMTQILSTTSAAKAAKHSLFCNVHVFGHLGAPAHILKVYSLRKYHAVQMCALVLFIYDTLVSARKTMSEVLNPTTAFGYVSI